MGREARLRKARALVDGTKHVGTAITLKMEAATQRMYDRAGLTRLEDVDAGIVITDARLALPRGL